MKNARQKNTRVNPRDIQDTYSGLLDDFVISYTVL